MSPTEDLRLEKFSAGEQFAVNPDAIERELAAIWRTAGRSTEAGQPVTRACLWNIVVHVEERAKREGVGHAKALVEMINRTSEHLAARGLVLHTRDGAEKLESWISANCILSGDGGKLVCSEEITLMSSGSRDYALPSLVRALLVPAIPTAAVFAGSPEVGDPMTAALIRLADRLVVHADASKRSNPLETIHGLINKTPLSAMDVGWLQDRQLRQEVASLFDPPRTPEAVASIDRVRLISPTSRKWSALLLLGWIASALGGSKPVRTSASTWNLKTRTRSVEFICETDDDAKPTLQIRVPSDDRTLEVCAEGGTTIAVTDETRTVQKRNEASRAALLAHALTSRSSDQAFERALAIARRFV